MTHRFALLALALIAAPAMAQQTPAPPPAAAPAEDLVPVALDTSMGRIVIALDRGHAPKTVANFLAYVDARKLDGESFYRAMPYGKGGLIQGGITSDARKLNKPVEFESTRVTGLHNKAGTIAMAPLAEMTLDDFRAAMDTNFWGAVHTTLAVLPGMRRRGEGRIVNVSSIAARTVSSGETQTGRRVIITSRTRGMAGVGR